MRLRNSHSKVPCPVPPEIQVSRCPGLPDRQNLALDHGEAPDPGQNIAGTFRVFYGRRIGPDPRFAWRALASAAASIAAQSLSVTVGRNQRVALRQQQACTGVSEDADETRKRAGGRSGRGVSSSPRKVTSRPDRTADSAAISRRFLGGSRLDAGEPDFAAVLETKAARIDQSPRRGLRPGPRRRSLPRSPDHSAAAINVRPHSMPIARAPAAEFNHDRRPRHEAIFARPSAFR